MRTACSTPPAFSVVSVRPPASVAHCGAAVATGVTRTVDGTAVDSELLEITGDAFRRVVLANPATVEQIGTAVAHRRAELEERRASGAAAAQLEPPHTLIERIRSYLNL